MMFPVAPSTAATEGSFSTTPSPFTSTRVLAVPRSTASSLAGRQVLRRRGASRRPPSSGVPGSASGAGADAVVVGSIVAVTRCFL